MMDDTMRFFSTDKIKVKQLFKLVVRHSDSIHKLHPQVSVVEEPGEQPERATGGTATSITGHPCQ